MHGSTNVKHNMTYIEQVFSRRVNNEYLVGDTYDSKKKTAKLL